MKVTARDAGVIAVDQMLQTSTPSECGASSSLGGSTQSGHQSVLGLGPRLSWGFAFSPLSCWPQIPPGQFVIGKMLVDDRGCEFQEAATHSAPDSFGQ